MWFLHKKAPPPSPAVAQPRPLVDDAFWFERSKEMVSGASSKRTEAAGKLQTTIGWFWTVYAAGAVVGASLADKGFTTTEATLIVLPIPLLVVGYWLAGWAQIPVGVKFDPRAPDEIRTAHEHSAQKKKERLLGATLVSAAGALLVIVAILTVALAETKTDQAGFSAAFDKVGARAQVVMGGDFPAGTKVVITVTPKAGAMLRRVVITPSSGQLERTFSVPVTESYDVTATWDEEKVGTRSLTKTVTGEKVEGSPAPGT